MGVTGARMAGGALLGPAEGTGVHQSGRWEVRESSGLSSLPRVGTETCKKEHEVRVQLSQQLDSGSKPDNRHRNRFPPPGLKENTTFLLPGSAKGLTQPPRSP